MRRKNVLVHQKKSENKELEKLLKQDSCQTLIKLGKLLQVQVDESTVLKHLKTLGMIQKQGHWVPYKLKAEMESFFAPYCNR